MPRDFYVEVQPVKRPWVPLEGAADAGYGGDDESFYLACNANEYNSRKALKGHHAADQLMKINMPLSVKGETHAAHG